MNCIQKNSSTKDSALCSCAWRHSTDRTVPLNKIMKAAEELEQERRSLRTSIRRAGLG